MAQTYTKCDFVLSGDVSAINISKTDSITFKIPQINVQLENILFPSLFASESLSLGAGLGLGYFQYELNSTSYNTFDVFAFLNLHFQVCNKFETFLGYMPGYYFGDKIKIKTNNFSGYEGFHSKGFVGIKYDLFDGFGIYSKVCSDKFISFGLSYRF